MKSAVDKELAMTRDGLTEKLLDIKREKGWTWKYICGRSAACRRSW